MKGKNIPKDVQQQVQEVIDRFNREHLAGSNCYYEARFQGKYLHLDRNDYGRSGPICRLTYTGDMKRWEFAIFKWSSETYDPEEWFFPGAEFVDGTIEGAMKAGLAAYPR